MAVRGSAPPCPSDTPAPPAASMSSVVGFSLKTSLQSPPCQQSMILLFFTNGLLPLGASRHKTPSQSHSGLDRAHTSGSIASGKADTALYAWQGNTIPFQCSANAACLSHTSQRRALKSGTYMRCVRPPATAAGPFELAETSLTTIDKALLSTIETGSV